MAVIRRMISAGLDGLGQIVGHACFQAALAVADHGGCGQGDDPNVAVVVTGFAVTDAGGGIEAVHFWHLAVHENQIIAVVAQGFHAGEAIADDLRSIAEATQQAGDELLVHGIVLGDEDAQRVLLAEGGIELGGTAFDRNRSGVLAVAAGSPG